MRSIRKTTTATIAGCALACAMPVFAAQGWGHQSSHQTTPNSASAGAQGAAQPSRSAETANKRAADLFNTINRGQVDMASMMASKTNNANVKDFADRLKNDHQQAQKRLQAVAGQANITLAENGAMKRNTEKIKNRLQNESNAQADRAFARDEIREHRDAIHRLQKLEPQVTDPQLKSYIKSEIPMLRQHLHEAEQLQSRLKK